MKITAAFVTSAVDADGLPRDSTSEIALVGRSNVGKSSLINALTRQRVARTSAAPGKTRLANIYRVSRGGAAPLYLIDLPGYGYARGGTADLEFVARMYFDVRLAPAARESRRGRDGPALAALLVVDGRHPGLESDRAAWAWLNDTVERTALVATKIDKLSRAERLRAISTFQAVFDAPVLPVSAVTGEGLDELWRLIDRLANSSSPPRRGNRSPHGGTAAPPRKE